MCREIVMMGVLALHYGPHSGVCRGARAYSRLEDILRSKLTSRAQARDTRTPLPCVSYLCASECRANTSLNIHVTSRSVGRPRCVAYMARMLSRPMQDNLNREARAVEDLDFLVSQRVLSPVQAAVFVAEAYPARPDGLVLASTCASLGGVPAASWPRLRDASAAGSVPNALTQRQGLPALTGACMWVDSKSMYATGEAAWMILHAATGRCLRGFAACPSVACLSERRWAAVQSCACPCGRAADSAASVCAGSTRLSCFLSRSIRKGSY